MKTALQYHGASSVQGGPYRASMSFKPNLHREPVWFSGQLEKPVRFREAMSALHEVVVGDLRFQRRDKTAYQAYLERRSAEEARVKQAFYDQALQTEMEAADTDPPPLDLEPQFRKAHRRYWQVRRKWAWELMKQDPELFRHLVPCDPIVTIADDVAFFEGFAKDESSYGCVFLDRNAIKGTQEARLGTTNVDYSMSLYESFQTLRSYRATELRVDPDGFEVKTTGQGTLREEKIDLPPSWLRAFGQLSASTGLPSVTVPLSVEVVYSLLAHLKRHRERTGPRAIRFELEPGKAPRIVLEPWEKRLVAAGPRYEGERAETIRVWGRRRLQVLSRLLPLAEAFEVHLLGTGMPHIWVARLGELRFVLGLSGWTRNDWSSGANLDLLAGATLPDAFTVGRVEALLRSERLLSFSRIASELEQVSKHALQAALHRLAKLGQVVYDFQAAGYRYRQILPAPLGEELLGPEPEEVTKGRAGFADKKVAITRTEDIGGGKTLVAGRVLGTSCEAIIDADGILSRARCPCPHHQKAGLRMGPCRHLIALRLEARRP